jgi:hypothetical protein
MMVYFSNKYRQRAHCTNAPQRHNFGELFSDWASKNCELLASLAGALKILILPLSIGIVFSLFFFFSFLVLLLTLSSVIAVIEMTLFLQPVIAVIEMTLFLQPVIAVIEMTLFLQPSIHKECYAKQETLLGGTELAPIRLWLGAVRLEFLSFCIYW